MKAQKVELIPILEDNYVFVLVDTERSSCVVVDPGEGLPVLDYIQSQSLTLKGVLLTHHHDDHTSGVRELLRKLGPFPVYAPERERRKMEAATGFVKDQEKIELDHFSFQVLEMPGHTLGHVAYFEPRHKWVFSGDVLFGLGCGRVFEGTYEQMFKSLQKMNALPDETLVFCAHEYTETNLNFCKRLSTFDGFPLIGGDEELEIYENQLKNRRSLGLPSVPLKLSLEKRVNPFLLAKDVQTFSELRDLRNKA